MLILRSFEAYRVHVSDALLAMLVRYIFLKYVATLCVAKVMGAGYDSVRCQVYLFPDFEFDA